MCALRERSKRIRLREWEDLTEVVGKVEEVCQDAIILSFKQRRVIPVKSDELVKWKNNLKVGSRVAILLLDDGSVRVKRP